LFQVYESGGDTKNILTKLSSYYLVIFSPIIFILFVYPQQVVALFSNKSYADAHIIIPFLAVSVFLYGLSEYTTLQYHFAKKTYITTVIRIIPGVLGLLLSVYLIPRIGLIGIGISTLISYALYFISSILINVKNLEWIPPYKDILKIVVALTCCGIYGYLTKSSLPFIPQISILTLIYITLYGFQKY
jgi:O-antigen/teichoic acid export membrane protein